jgi:uncharacterized protein (TIGR02145 family)
MKMKYITIAISLLSFIIMFSCEREEKISPPKVETESVDEIYNTSARVGGRVTSNGGADVTERGTFWGTSAKPQTSGTKLQMGSGNGTFNETLTGLISGIKYYVTAYATNSAGTSYGDETFFTTQISLPTVITSPVTEYTSTSATVGGSVTDDGGYDITMRGVYWGTEPDTRLTGTRVEIGSGDGDFSKTFTELSRSVTYYVIAFATNIKGTSYGSEISFSTEPELPVVITATILNITPYSAKAGGVVSSSGGTDITERGIYWGTTANPVSTGTKLATGSGTGIFTDSLANLIPGTTYYVTAYAINGIGTAYGEEKSFLTPGEEPEIVKILDFRDLTTNSVVLSGIIAAGELSTTVTFEIGLTTSYGASAEADGSPLTEKDTVSALITGLTPNTLYHYRITAENDLGIAYSADSTFRTVITGIQSTVTDPEGNIYKTIGIGYQEWMTENLKSVVYRNGTDSIPIVEGDSLWGTLTTPAYCWYGGDSTANYSVYGALYNWYAINTGNLCPTGWHVPTNDDVTELISYTGGAGAAGGLLKETGTGHWNTPNTGATNKYGFTARGGGKRAADGVFDFVKVEGNWWTSTEYSTLNASYLNILFNYGNSFQAYMHKRTGMSVRCVKN